MREVAKVGSRPVPKLLGGLLVAWFWTDDLARLLVESGVDGPRVSELMSRPAAIAAEDESAALAVAIRLIGGTGTESDAA